MRGEVEVAVTSKVVTLVVVHIRVGRVVAGLGEDGVKDVFGEGGWDEDWGDGYGGG